MKRKLVALMLCAAMVMTALTGCGGTEENVEESAATDSTDSADTADSEEDSEPAEIVVALMCLSPMSEDQTQHVEDKLNEILEEKVNVHADFQWYDASTYASAIPMMISANEQIDLMMFTPNVIVGYQSFMTQNQLVDITDYMDEYGQDIKNVLGDYLTATSKEGRIYGVGNNTSLYASAKICMRKDVLDDLGLTEKAQNMTTWSEFEDILKEVTANTDLKGLVNSDADGTVMSSQPYMFGGDSFSDAYSVDCGGDSYQYVYIDEDSDQVKCYFDSDDWKASILRVKDFYDEGLIYKDAATAQDYADTLIKNGVGFAEVKGSELGVEASYEAATGYEPVVVDITDAKVTTKSFTKFGFAVPVTAEEPAAAVKVLNLMYSDQEFIDTLVWGVEGVDWVLNDDGLATYPDGVTSDTVQYHTADFLYGDRLQVTPWEGSDVDIREQQNETNQTMEQSKYLGFSVDSTDVSSEITAVNNVWKTYYPQLVSGNAEDVEATYQEFIDKLYAAGMQTVLDTYQAQLDEWLAAQN